MIWQICSGVKMAGAPQRGASLNRSATLAAASPQPAVAPVARRLAPDTEFLGRLAHAPAFCGEHDDACPIGQLLWCGMRPHQCLQLAVMVRRKFNRWSLGCRHGSPSPSRRGGDSHSESTADSPATAGGEPISAVCCIFDSPSGEPSRHFRRDVLVHHVIDIA
jgi:hypothetical protein